LGKIAALYKKVTTAFLGARNGLPEAFSSGSAPRIAIGSRFQPGHCLLVGLFQSGESLIVNLNHGAVLRLGGIVDNRDLIHDLRVLRIGADKASLNTRTANFYRFWNEVPTILPATLVNAFSGWLPAQTCGSLEQ
jgi:hypothetical protein